MVAYKDAPAFEKLAIAKEKLLCMYSRALWLLV